MASTVSEVNSAGDLYTTSIPIVEPINAPANFDKILTRFGENYNVSTTSHLYRFLLALCGEAGAGSLKKSLLYPRLQSRLESTHFTDLDRLYGNALGLPRLANEIYHYDPFHEMLENEQWNEVYAKDAAYRQRCLTWMRAIIEGSTLTGIKLAAEAGLGVDCDVTERYLYLDNAASDEPISLANIGQTNSRNEFVIVPREPTVSLSDERSLMRLMSRIRPVNSICTLTTGDYLRTLRDVTNMSQTSEAFRVLRYVTGRSDVMWPSTDVSQGYWVNASVEKEAPTYAFMDRQESITYLTITDADASSWQVGPFNKQQRELFSHLNLTVSSTQQFIPEYSFNNITAPITTGVPWVSRQDSLNERIVVNNFYPLSYFSLNGISLDTAQPVNQFWASAERTPDVQPTETLTLDLGTVRPVNFIDFEISQKPIDFTILWSADGTTWDEIDPLPEQNVVSSVAFMPSNDNPWLYITEKFTLVNARYVRLTFTRRNESFPLPTTTPFPWSIEVRGLRLMHMITAAEEFVADAGTDVLGNSYRTELVVYDGESVLDADTSTFWQSQPNPTRSAVEALYFDLRIGFHSTNMSYLDGWQVGEIESWGINDLDNGHYVDAIVIDEIYLDPITFGPNMRVYYSLDDNPDWDNKLWVPIPRNYKLKRGYAALPSPTMVKYVKLEFTDLAAVPYQSVDYPAITTAQYRKHPTWVQNLFGSLYSAGLVPTDPVVTNQITIDPIELAFKSSPDALTQSYEDIREQQDVDTTSEIATFIQQVVSQTSGNADQTAVESKIRMRTPIQWQEDLIQQLDPSRALTRVATELRDGVIDTGFNSELNLPISTVPIVQSTSDQQEAWNEKHSPPMYFPFKCRHGYQILEAPYENKIAYQVALREVGFYRRDYTVVFDEDIYIETLDDDSHTEVNEFTQNGWQFTV